MGAQNSIIYQLKLFNPDLSFVFNDIKRINNKSIITFSLKSKLKYTYSYYTFEFKQIFMENSVNIQLLEFKIDKNLLKKIIKDNKVYYEQKFEYYNNKDVDIILRTCEEYYLKEVVLIINNDLLQNPIKLNSY